MLYIKINQYVSFSATLILEEAEDKKQPSWAFN